MCQCQSCKYFGNCSDRFCEECIGCIGKMGNCKHYQRCNPFLGAIIALVISLVIWSTLFYLFS